MNVSLTGVQELPASRTVIISKFVVFKTFPAIENVEVVIPVSLYQPVKPKPPTSNGPITVPVPVIVGVKPTSKFRITISSTGPLNEKVTGEIVSPLQTSMGNNAPPSSRFNAGCSATSMVTILE